MSNIVNDQTNRLLRSEKLNRIGQERRMLRNDGESDADYADRMVYELDVAVEELWAVQDTIRELVKVDE